MDALTAAVTAENSAELIRYFEKSAQEADKLLSTDAKAAISRTSKKLSLFSGAISQASIRKIRSITASVLKDDLVPVMETSMDVALSSRFTKDLIASGSQALYTLSSNGHLKHKTKYNKEEAQIIKDEIYRGTIGYHTNDNGEVDKTMRTVGRASTIEGELGKVVNLTETERSNVRHGINLANLSLGRGRDPFSVL